MTKTLLKPGLANPKLLEYIQELRDLQHINTNGSISLWRAIIFRDNQEVQVEYQFNILTGELSVNSFTMNPEPVNMTIYMSGCQTKDWKATCDGCVHKGADCERLLLAYGIRKTMVSEKTGTMPTTDQVDKRLEERMAVAKDRKEDNGRLTE